MPCNASALHGKVLILIDLTKTEVTGTRSKKVSKAPESRHWTFHFHGFHNQLSRKSSKIFFEIFKWKSLWNFITNVYPYTESRQKLRILTSSTKSRFSRKSTKLRFLKNRLNWDFRKIDWIKPNESVMN